MEYILAALMPVMAVIMMIFYDLGRASVLPPEEKPPKFNVRRRPAEKPVSRAEIIARNVERYDGTGEGQEDIADE